MKINASPSPQAAALQPDAVVGGDQDQTTYKDEYGDSFTYTYREGFGPTEVAPELVRSMKLYPNGRQNYQRAVEHHRAVSGAVGAAVSGAAIVAMSAALPVASVVAAAVLGAGAVLTGAGIGWYSEVAHQMGQAIPFWGSPIKPLKR